jgi:hypothetical protein
MASVVPILIVTCNLYNGQTAIGRYNTIDLR